MTWVENNPHISVVPYWTPFNTFASTFVASFRCFSVSLKQTTIKKNGPIDIYLVGWNIPFDPLKNIFYATAIKVRISSSGKTDPCISFHWEGYRSHILIDKL